MKLQSVFRTSRVISVTFPALFLTLFFFRASGDVLSPVLAQTSAPTNAAPLDSTITAIMTKATESFEQSDFPAALESLKKLYAEHPNLTPPRIVMAQWFAQSNLGEAVRASLEMATEETPNDPEAYLLLGEILLRQRYLTAAEAMLKTAESRLKDYNVNPDRKKQMQSSLSRNQISLAEFRSRWESVASLVDQAVKQEGETPALLRQKGVALFQMKKESEAMSSFTKADSLNQDEKAAPGLPAEAAMSQLYQLRDDKENAQKYLAEALKKYPKSKEVIVLSIQARLNESRLEEAQQLAERLLTDNPDWQPAKQLRATIALYLNDYTTAEKLFQELILDSPGDVQAVNGLALAQCEQNDPQKLQRALEYARENVRKNQQNSDYWATLGWVLLKANQLEASAQALKQSAAAGQVNAATAYYLARLALQSGKVPEAKQLLEAAVSSPSPFAKRRDAVLLLNELKK